MFGLFKPKEHPLEKRNPEYAAAVRMIYDKLYKRQSASLFNDNVGRLLSQEFDSTRAYLEKHGVSKTMNHLFKYITGKIDEIKSEAEKSCSPDELRMFGYGTAIACLGRVTLAIAPVFVDELNLTEFDIATKMVHKLSDHYYNRSDTFYDGVCEACSDLHMLANQIDRQRRAAGLPF